jgi:hypothetical protein
LVVPQDKKTLNRTIDVIIAFVIFIVKQFWIELIWNFWESRSLQGN